MSKYLNLKTAVQGNKVMQSFELESPSTGGNHSQKEKAPPFESDYSSKDCVTLLPSTAVSRLKSAILIIALCGCSVGPKYIPPEADIPCEWHSNISEGMTIDSSEDSSERFVWWERLNDPVLTSLIERASSQNLDIQIAALRVFQARRILIGKKADILPKVDGSISYNHAYYNQKTLNELLGIKKCARHAGKRNVDIFEIGFDADWEIDLFGKTLHEICAMRAEVEAAEEGVSEAWVTLSAEIGKTYIQLRGYQEQLILVKKSIDAQQEVAALTADLISAGFADSISQNQSQEQLNLLKAKQPLLEFAINKTIYRLSILLGHSPAELYDELICSCSELPSLPQNQPICVPSELLRRRPDVRKAEREVAAATERVGSAIAGMFPRLSLRGFIGDINTHLPSLLGNASNTWLAGPQLLLPIFNSRLIEQDIALNKMKTEQALLEYQKTVLNALEETENSIGAFHYEMERNQFLADSMHTSQEAYTLISDLYQNGVKNYFEVLTIQRSMINNEEAYIQSKVDLLIHYISLYKALGGAWISDCI